MEKTRPVLCTGVGTVEPVANTVNEEQQGDQSLRSAYRLE